MHIKVALSVAMATPWSDQQGVLLALMVVVVHILHSDTAPHTDHKGLDLALVLPTCDAEEAILTPGLPPRVGSNLFGGNEGDTKNTALGGSRDKYLWPVGYRFRTQKDLNNNCLP